MPKDVRDLAQVNRKTRVVSISTELYQRLAHYCIDQDHARIGATVEQWITERLDAVGYQAPSISREIHQAAEPAGGGPDRPAEPPAFGTAAARSP